MIIAVLLLYATNISAQCDFDDFPVMDGMQVKVVMDNANYNNRPMMVRSYYAEISSKDLINYYHRKWKGRYDDTAFGIWHQVTTLNDECMMTVQVAAQGIGSSYGRLIISNPPTGNPRAELGEGVIAPAESVVVSDLQTQDGSQQGRVTMLTSSLSPSEIQEFYMSEMGRLKWSLDRRFREGEHVVLVFRKGLDIRNILVTPAGDMSQILINEVEH